MVYFGILNYLAMHFSDFIFRGVDSPDVHSHHNVMVLTAGITIAMFFLGAVADKWGVRLALILALSCMLVGRVVIASAPTLLHLEPNGLWSSLHLTTIAGILIVVIGYGMYQPAAYAAVRQFTTPKTAGMAFAMLYALMNLGGWLPTFFGPIRERVGIPGAYWVYTGFTVLALLSTIFILSRETVARAIAATQAEKVAPTAAPAGASSPPTAVAAADTPDEALSIPWHLWGVWVVGLVGIYFIANRFWRITMWAVVGALPVLVVLLDVVGIAARRWIATHPLANGKFFFFIFSLIPVQTLFTYNWFILPQYVSRTYVASWIGRYFEVASSLNSLLIFIFVPIIAALTQKRKVYNMMTLGTFIMAAPAFLLAFGPSAAGLFGYILLMTIGEAMWQPRFLQYAAEIAPEGRTGQYMGVAQLPWFLTKVLVPMIYSGEVMAKYCPKEGPKDTGTMWLIFSCIAICSSILLFAAKPWVGKDFKTKAA